MAEIENDYSVKFNQIISKNSHSNNVLYPVSIEQETIWLDDTLLSKGAKDALIISNSYRIIGEINFNRLKKTFIALLCKNPAFRSTFVLLDNCVIQEEHEIYNNADYYGEFIDLGKIPLWQVEKLIETSSKNILDIKKKVFDFQLYKYDDKQYLLVFYAHHIICDHIGFLELSKQFFGLYHTLDETSDLKTLTQNKRNPQLVLEKREIQLRNIKAHEYWKKTFVEDVVKVNIPQDFDYPQVSSGNSSWHVSKINASKYKKLKKFSKKHKTTPFIVLSSLYQLLLHKLSGSIRIPLFIAFNTRDKEVKDELGYFINALPLVAKVNVKHSFSDFIGEMKDIHRQVSKLRSYPYSEVNKLVRYDRKSTVHPLQRFTTTYRYAKSFSEKASDVEFIYNPLNALGNSGTDLSLVFVDNGSNISLELNYNIDIFKDNTARSFLNAFVVLLNQVLINSEVLLEDLYLTPSNNYDSEQTVISLYEEQAAKTPLNIAIVSNGEELTYEELNKQANSLAHYLVLQGVKPNTLIGLCIERSLDMIIGLLAILKTGGAYVPIDTSYPKDRIEYIVKDSDIKLLLTHTSMQKLLKGIGGQQVYIDVHNFGEYSQEDLGLDIKGNDLAYVIYTSGTSGLPKGVMIEHSSLNNYILNMKDRLDINENTSSALVTTIAADLGKTVLYPVLCSGGTVHVVSQDNILDANKFSTYIHENSITMLKIVPSHFSALFQDSSKYKSLNKLILGGESASIELINSIKTELPFLDIFNHYGPTEATIGACMYELKDDFYKHSIPIGTPLENTHLYILDKDKKHVEKGLVGELFIAGIGLARGYLNREKLTSEKFINNPFVANTKMYQTGDLVRLREDGKIEYIGRIDDQVKIRGFRVELAEIEEQLLHIQDIKDGIVLAKDDGVGNKTLVAYIVSKDKQNIDIKKIKRELSQRLPKYMLPSKFIILEMMPFTANGKVDKKVLDKMEVTTVSLEGYVTAKNKMQESLVEIFSKLLKLDNISIVDSFFDLGGHSLLAIQLISRVRDQLNFELPLRELFKYSTVEGLEYYISNYSKVTRGINIDILKDRTNLPLSSSQERLWFLEQFEEGKSLAYNLPKCFKLEGYIDIEALQKSFSAIVDRHDILRTNFIEKNNKPIQIIRPAKDNYLDVRSCSKEEMYENIQSLLQRPFDLSIDRLFYAILYTVNSGEHYLFRNMHHSISDGWSSVVFAKEITQLYAAYSKKEENPLEPMSIQYADYAVWQNQYLTGKVLEEKLSYWRNELADINTLELPTSFPRPLEQTHRGNTITFSINEEITSKLYALNKHFDTTLFMTLLSCFSVLLHRYTQQDNIVIGTPVANRNRSEVENLIGFFVNTLAFKQDFSNNPSFDSLLLETKRKILDSYEYQDLPFEKIVDALKIPRDSSRSPLFQVMFVLQNNEKSKLDLDGVVVKEELLRNDTAKFDLLFNVVEDSGKLNASFEYASDLFSMEYIEKMIQNFQILLAAITENTNEKVSLYPLLSKQEQSEQLHKNNLIANQYNKVQTIHQLFQKQVQKTPNNIAVKYKSTVLSYNELNKKANQLAHYLLKKGVKSEDLIALSVENSLEMVIGLLAVLKSGGAYVPIDPHYPSDRIQYMLENSKAKIVLTQKKIEKNLPSVVAEVICIDDFEENLFSQENPYVQMHSKNLMYVIYTSGSTGRPKGVMVEHVGIHNLLNWYTEKFNINENSSTVLVSSLSFDLTQKNIFSLLITGGRLILPRNNDFNPDHILDLLSTNQCDFLNCAPSAFYAILKASNNNFSTLQYLKYVFLGGESINLEYILKWLEQVNTTLVNTYGPTECSDVVSYYEMRKKDNELTSIPIGKPVDNTQLYILDKNHKLLPNGSPGELYISGDGISRGYLGQEDLTHEKFLDNPFYSEQKMYKTGDLVKWLKDGNLEYIGRIDDQVKIHGFRIELAEIQQQTLAIDLIKECIVLAKEDSSGNKSLVSYIVTHDNLPVDLMNIKVELSKYLPTYMVPNNIIVLEKMPLTPNAKIDKKALEKIDVKFQSSTKYIAPRNEIEKKLEKIFCEVLNLKKVGVNDDFFEMGGHSLLATQLVSKVRHELRVELSLRELFKSSCIQKLYDYIQNDAQATNISNIKVLKDRTSLPLSYAQERLWFLDKFEENSAAYNMNHFMRLEGNVNVEALEESFKELIKRHESLRTNFAALQTELIQVIGSEKKFRLEYLVCSKIAMETEVKKLEEMPFDLEKELLIRANLFAVSKEEFYLLLSLHNIIADGWSVGVLAKELASLYCSFSYKKSPSLIPLNIQYGDYCAWQKDYLSGDVLKNKLRYWQEELKNIPVLALETNFPRPQNQSYTGKKINFEINEAITHKLQVLNKNFDTTLFMSLLSIFSVLLHRYSGQNDIVIGTITANRNHHEIENTIGNFVNTLATRQYYHSNISFTELLLQVKENVLNIYEHQDVPFEKVVDALNLERDLSHAPVFQVLFALQNHKEASFELEGIKIEEQELESMYSKFDLTLGMQEVDNKLEGSLIYASDLFSASYIELMIENFQILLFEITKRFDQNIDSYTLNDERYNKSELYLDNINYWKNRMSSCSDGPDFSLKNYDLLEAELKPTWMEYKLEENEFKIFKGSCKNLELSIQLVLLSMYSKVLSKWSNNETFCISLDENIFSPVIRVNNANEKNISNLHKDIKHQVEKNKSHVDIENNIFMKELNSLVDENNLPVVFKFFTENKLYYNDENNLYQNAWIYNTINENNGGLLIRWKVSEELFYDDFIQSMFDAYIDVIKQFVNNQVIIENNFLNLLSAKQMAKRIDYNQTQTVLKEETLPLQCMKMAFQYPQNKAVVVASEYLTYKQLHNASVQLANYIDSIGMKNNSHIALILPKGWEQIVGVMGVGYAGMAYLPIDVNTPQERIKTILEAAEVELVLTDDSLFNVFDFSVKVQVLSALIDVNKGEDKFEVKAKTSEVAYTIFTSGSTGKPKGVVITHESVCNTVMDINARFKVTKEDKIFALASLNFDLSVYDIYGALSIGACLVLPKEEERKDPSAWLKLAVKEKISIWNSVPAIVNLLCEEVSTQKINFPSNLRLILMSGDFISISLTQELQRLSSECEIISLGGATEASIWSIYYPLTDTNYSKVPYGYPLANQEIHILDSFQQICPNYVHGDIYIKGKGLAQGYLNDLEKTRAQFIKDKVNGENLYKTGDIGYFTNEGFVHIVGRKDEQVKIQGYRVELGEIEQQLLSFNEVKQCIVVVQEDESNNKILLAFVESTQKLNIEEMKVQLASYLPEYMLPKHISIIDSMPLTSNGKVDKKALLQLQIQEKSHADYMGPRDELEIKLVSIFEEVLNKKRVGIKDDFFDLGGHSLLSVKLMAKINSMCNVSLALAVLFQASTVEKLAEIINSNGYTREILVPIQIQGNKIPIFALPGQGGSTVVYNALSKVLGSSQPFYGLDILESVTNTSPFTSFINIAKANVAEMRSITPTGPYQILCYSNSGPIAYEMARLLPGEVESMIMLDCYYVKVKSIKEYRYAFKRISVFIIKALMRSLLKIGMPKKIKSFVYEHSTTSRGRFSALCFDWYTPTKISTKLNVLLLILKTAVDAGDEDHGWKKLLGEDIDIDIIHGDHLSLLREENTENLSLKINNYYTQLNKKEMK